MTAATVASGTQLLADPSRTDGWTVLIDGVPHSYVATNDPTVLRFECTRWMAAVIDHWGNPGEPVHVAHLGGAGGTIARYIAHCRPGSRQVVLEVDATLVEMAEQAFRLDELPGTHLRRADGRAGVEGLPDASCDIVVRDAFLGDRVPAHLGTVEYYQEVARVLRPTGVHVANTADNASSHESRYDAAAALEVFGDAAIIARTAQLRSRRRGNVVLLASPDRIPGQSVEGIRQRLTGDTRQTAYLPAAEVRDLVSGYRSRRDADVV